ncbi:MAG TPA: hypothetical protein VHE08_00920 [Solirubrobacterales bacterium]|nr:hypothetical protein [Solirubrobacterales bacterium]
MIRRTCLAVLLSAAAALSPSAAAAAELAVEPGSFLAKAHATVPLAVVHIGAGHPTEREIDVAAIAAAPDLTQAGAHPDVSTHATFTAPGGTQQQKDIRVEAPPGLVGNPTVVPACDMSSFEATFKGQPVGGCPPASQVGVASTLPGTGFYFTSPVYRLATPPGAPASFGFPFRGVGILLRPTVRSDGDYGLTITARDIPSVSFPVHATSVTLWGVPAASVHDPERWDPQTFDWGASSELTPRPFLSNPADCDSGPLTTRIGIETWQRPGEWLPAEPDDPAYRAESPAPTGCARLRFGGPGSEASLSFQPGAHAADTPSSYRAKLALPYDEDPEGLANPPLRDTTVVLPEGVVANAAAANGLAACSEDQIGYLGNEFPLPNPIRFSEEEPRCPDASKLGTVVVHTPLLEKDLEGSVYLAAQEANPFGSLLAIYLAIDDAETGIVVKLAGKVTTDPATGRLTATFADNPQLPFTELDLSLFGGPGASLANPSTCGTATTTSTLTPWSAPYTPAVTSTDSFKVTAGPDGAACVSTESQLPFSPGFEAGTVSTQAGAHAPLVLKLVRKDGEQEPTHIEFSLPPGLTARLAGIPYCPAAAIAAAGNRSGRVEQADPSCPAASRIGTVSTTAGAGTEPVDVGGHVYLAGPYKGAPLSAVVITPAVAGPFDLGTVVVRAPLFVDPETARITARSDEIPHILKGIPLKLRSVEIKVDRQDFTLNPTSCEPMTVGAAVSGLNGATASPSNRFQVGGCGELRFKPALKLRLKGATKRVGHPALKAVLTAKPGEANIGRAQVNLPHGEFLDQGNLNKTCTKPVLLAGNCPASTVYGRAKAWTPLLDQPLQGPVYLVGGYGYKLPALVAELNGQVKVLLVGKVDSGKNKGIRNTFEVVPDAPVSRFELSMKGGKRYGLLENSENLCKAKKAKRRAIVRFTGQNGKVEQFKPVVANQCGKGKNGSPVKQ